jgi:hypothetical protein
MPVTPDALAPAQMRKASGELELLLAPEPVFCCKVVPAALMSRGQGKS